MSTAPNEAGTPRRLCERASGAPLTALTTLAAVLAAALLTLAGCASPGTVPPSHTLLDAAAQGATTDTATPWPVAGWWQAHGAHPHHPYHRQAQTHRVQRHAIGTGALSIA